ncbi:MAG: peptidase domain-containing ABC transporter [Bacteroidetes bacterium]|nr:peptidase domain-containing ABC transporter [Bacteroidota bacterium]MCL2303336.1 peptidase domain-containing ABC transporter [Lentimicrobiaceae bacterium]
MSRKFPFYQQPDTMDCGATCLAMVAKHYGKTYTIQKLREMCSVTRAGVSLLGISDAAEKLGFKTVGVKLNFEKLAKDVPLPCIVHWRQEHFVVVYKTKLRKGKSTSENSLPEGIVYVADPGHGLIQFTVQEFCNSWLSTKKDGEEEGIALLLEPTPAFYEQEDEKSDRTKFSYIFRYLKPYRKYIIQLFLGLLLGSLLQLIFPFLTQSIVDYGISNQNLSFVTLILIAQLVLFTSQTVVEFIRSWILLHITARINISMISDFLIKLMKLPIRFFDIKMIGDIMQRINDNSRIQNFLTSSSINTLFSFFNLIIFSIVLGLYNLKILGIFLLASVLYVLWIVIFLKRRKELDYKRFAQASAEQSNLYQLITGMQEIKLNNSEKQKRWEWENIQIKLFNVSIKGLALSQYQQAGAFFIDQTKNIVISFFAAQAVINGNMTLGMMMAVQYIIGQLNAPIGQLIGFVQSAQDAKISLERLGEIHNREDEENPNASKIMLLPQNRTVSVQNLTFQYDGQYSETVLDNVNLEIPSGKVTAIVGMSGSGKTTLVKLLLGFYLPVKGEIKIGEYNLQNINAHVWRGHCGAVMQDGYIFSDTIARNIAVGDEIVDTNRLLHAAKVANIQEMVEGLPLGYNTKIGQEGQGISQGQRQRILIARAVYKNPEYIFFDEATNALDANNEKVIMENLDEFFEGKTVVVVAHRLSTVKNADNIVVLEKGKIVEQGTHKELTKLKGIYYELVKNQLELGN